MAAVSGYTLPVGTRLCRVYGLNSNGRPAATSAALYEGVEVEGIKGFTLNEPGPRPIVHVGEDRALGVDFLPATELATAEIAVAKVNYVLDALLSAVNFAAIGASGEGKGVLRSTDKKGSEPQVGFLITQQALGAQKGGSDNGARRWRNIVIPRATLVPLAPGMGDSPIDMRYQINMAVVSKHLWGLAFTTSIEGATEGQYFDYESEGKANIANFLGDASTVAFNFHASRQATATGKIIVYVNGAEVTAGITKATTGVTWAVAPAASADIQIIYEY